MKKFLFLLIFFAFLFCSCATHKQTIPVIPAPQIETIVQEKKQIIPDNSLDSRLENLTNQIVESLSHESKSKIAVIEFSDLNGNITEFGMYLSEELITRLFLTRKFDVIERQLLNQVISEQKLGMTGLIDDDSAIAIGKLLGVDAIVSGTIIDLGVSLKVNARIIATETGSVFAVAATEIIKDEKVKILINRMKETKQTVIKKKETEKPEKKTVEKKTTVDERIFFKEDFSAIVEGMVPKDWIGTDHLMVQSKGNQKLLTHFENGNAKLIINGIILPENFKIEWTFFTHRVSGWENPGSKLILGNLRAGVYNSGLNTYCYINNTRKRSNFDVINNTIKVTVEKNGSLFRLLVDGNEQIFVRYPNFKSSTTLALDFGEYNFNLYEIIGTDLGNE